MKVDKVELGLFIAGIVTVTILVLLIELSGNDDDRLKHSYMGSHGVYDHHTDKGS